MLSSLLFRYLAARWRHPDPLAKGYMRAGIGLETRARLLHTYWTSHFSRTRAAQARWVRNAQGKILTVLGAGPLLDFNAAALSPRFETFRLVDANPLLASGWGRLNKPVEPVVTDITNCLAAWTAQVKTFRGTWDQTLALIRDLAHSPVPAYAAPSDALLSLNVLSQLEIVWQEALEPLLQKRFGHRFVAHREQAWLASIEPSARLLIEQHLAALAESGARYLLLISDLDYVEYTGRDYQRSRLEEPPLQWTGSGWRADDAIHFEALSALAGVLLDQTTFRRWLPAYQLDWHESWLWHIAPKGIETTEYGKLHRVGAFALSRLATGARSQ